LHDAGTLSATSSTLENYELVFNQDLNGDGVIGPPPPPPPTVIQTDTGTYGSTSLVEVGNNFFLYAAGTSSGPELKYNSAAVTTGEFGSWTPIGAIQTATGYDVAWHQTGTSNYGVWTTDGNGN